MILADWPVRKTLRGETRAVSGTTKEKSEKWPLDSGPEVVLKKDIANTVFDYRWALTVFDEAHEFRSEGVALRGVHLLRVRSGCMLFASATPLHNGVQVSGCESQVYLSESDAEIQDLVSLAGGLGLPAPVMAKLWEHKRMYDRKLKNARNAAKNAGKSMVVRGKTAAMQLVKGVEKEESEAQKSIREAGDDAVRAMRAAFSHNIIRRTRDSQDKDGNNISGIPPATFHQIVVDFTPAERDAFQKIIDSVVNEL